MAKNKSKAEEAYKFLIEQERKLHPTQYQEALLFKFVFQKSNQCKNFRKAWGIPRNGFKNDREYNEWESEIIRKTNLYFKSERYKWYRRQVEIKKRDRKDGKISELDLKIFADRGWNAIPLFKYDIDIDWITRLSGKPLYWRRFVEKCLFFRDFKISPVLKPLPEPRLKWNNNISGYELIIENIFPDTIVKDFLKRRFTKKFKELQKKLPGYQVRKPRLKNIGFGIKILELDKRQKTKKQKMSDYEKAEELEGEISSSDWGLQENLRRNRLKQTRYRLKKYLKNAGNFKS